MTDETGPDWADEEASQIINNAIGYSCNFHSDALAIASALRRAKASGLREAEEIVLNTDYLQITNQERVARAIRAEADKLEKEHG